MSISTSLDVKKMSSELSDNKRIAKNTIFLYGRQLFSLLVSLLTAGVTLNALGVTDYGIYNVVGGIIGTVGFLTRTISGGAQRFLAFDMVKGDKKKLNHTFCSIAMSCYIVGAVVFLLLETIGVWFLNTHMTIPTERLTAANWVLQFSILQFVLGATTAPYMSVVIAREKMDIFAYVGVAETVFRLVILFLIVVCPTDKLVTLAFLNFVISSGVRLYYQWYCKRHFEEAELHFIWDGKKIKELMTFSGWSIIPVFANSCRMDGTNIIINLFFNPAVNAARGIANQINSAVLSFTQNFMTAVNPQIIKSYSAKNIDKMHELICMSSRLSFYLFLVLCVPVALNIDQILVLWLRNPPEYTSVFVNWILLSSLIEILSNSLNTGVIATGAIKYFHIIVSGLYILILPISYLFLYLGYPAESTLWVNAAIVLISYLPRLLFCRKLFNLSIRSYLFDVIIRTFIVAFLCFLLCYFVNSLISVGTSIFRLILSSLATFIVSFLIVCFIGLKKHERSELFSIVSNKIRNNRDNK